MIKTMARRPVLPKLDKLGFDGSLWDGYRGNRSIIWSYRIDKNANTWREFAIECKCGIWYGWVKDPTIANKVYKKLQKFGCKECKS
jgi:hypothetical protein